MYKLFVIAKNNMKKQKGDMITFLILTFLSAFLIFDCASAMIGISKVMDDTFKSINGAHVMIISRDIDELNKAGEKVFKENKKIKSYEQTPVSMITAEYRKKGEKDYMDYSFLAESFDVQKNIMKVKKPVSSFEKNDILLPFNMSGNYKVGDVIQLKLEDDIYDFNVVGYLEDPYFCSTMNITLYSVCMSQEMLDEMKEDHLNLAIPFVMHKGRVDEKAIEDGTIKTMDLESEIGNEYKDEVAEAAKINPEIDSTNYMLANWQMMRGGSQFIPLIVVAIILVFAVLILLIAIVIISFSVKNFIQKNMKSTGILEASGYTVGELRWALTIQILLVGLLGSILGIAAGVLTFEAFGNIIAAVLGLVWNQPVNWTIAVLTVVGVVAVLGLVSRIISRSYKKITVLDALRGGISTHNYRKNFFSFENTPLPVSLTMALKDTFGGLGKNLLMVFVAIILAISMLIGFGLLENFGKDPQTIINMFGFETGTVLAIDDNNSSDYEKISSALRKVNGVDRVLTLSGFEPTVTFNDKEQTIYTFAIDRSENSGNTIVLEGRMPEKDNEIMVTSAVAEDLGVKIGDVISIKFASEEDDYLVVGINQRMERMGRTILMTIEGAKRIVPGVLKYQYYLTADESGTYESIVKNIEKLEKDEEYCFSCSDINKSMMATVDTLSISMSLICIIISIITVLVVIFVESLVIRAKISREWRGMGISKALGQTSGNLITQIMLSNMPAILVGTVIGAIVAPFAGSTLCKTIFSLFVIKDVPFDIPSYYMLITVVGIVLIAVLSSASAGLKVRKLKPVEMITEE